jgi:hypothetical protein
MAEATTETQTQQTQTSEAQTQQTSQQQAQAQTQTSQQAQQQETQQTSQTQTGDWRSILKSDEAKEFAKNSPDLDHFAARALEMRKQLSSAIIKPGKDAKPEAIAAYRKALDIPDDPKGYEFVKPEYMSDEDFASENTKASLANIAKVAHEAGAPKAAVAALWSFYTQAEAKALENAKAADKSFVEQTEAQLRKDWGADFETNKTFANRAFYHWAEKAGVDASTLKGLKTAGDRFLVDHPEIMRVFGTIGREMGEGTLGSVHSESDIAALDGQIEAKRTAIREAKAKGDSRKANALYQEVMSLQAKKGNGPIVGTAGKAA